MPKMHAIKIGNRVGRLACMKSFPYCNDGCPSAARSSTWCVACWSSRASGSSRASVRRNGIERAALSRPRHIGKVWNYRATRGSRDQTWTFKLRVQHQAWALRSQGQRGSIKCTRDHTVVDSLWPAMVGSVRNPYHLIIIISYRKPVWMNTKQFLFFGTLIDF